MPESMQIGRYSSIVLNS